MPANFDATIAGLAQMAPSVLNTDDFNVGCGTTFDHQSPMNSNAIQDINIKLGEKSQKMANLTEQPEEEEQTPAGTAVSKKEKEMMEIAALIAKATNTISETVENEA